MEHDFRSFLKDFHAFHLVGLPARLKAAARKPHQQEAFSGLPVWEGSMSTGFKPYMCDLSPTAHERCSLCSNREYALSLLLSRVERIEQAFRHAAVREALAIASNHEEEEAFFGTRYLAQLEEDLTAFAQNSGGGFQPAPLPFDHQALVRMFPEEGLLTSWALAGSRAAIAQILRENPNLAE